MKKNNDKNEGVPWSIKVFIIALTLSAVLSYLSTILLKGAGAILAIIILLLIIGLGIFFDMIGVAVTAADIQPFHSMAAHKEKGAKEAIQLINRANEFSSIFNDVVGDICGIISGTTATIIVLHLQNNFNTTSVIVSILVTALISALTIGGKALGKEFALKNSTKVVHLAALGMNFLHINLKKKK